MYFQVNYPQLQDDLAMRMEKMDNSSGEGQNGWSSR